MEPEKLKRKVCYCDKVEAMYRDEDGLDRCFCCMGRIRSEYEESRFKEIGITKEECIGKKVEESAFIPPVFSVPESWLFKYGKRFLLGLKFSALLVLVMVVLIDVVYLGMQLLIQLAMLGQNHPFYALYILIVAFMLGFAIYNIFSNEITEEMFKNDDDKE